MRDITATVLPGGPVTVEGIPGFAEEHNAARLIVELNDELSAADISCHYLCFDLYGLARKIISNPIYGANNTPAYRQGKRLFCPLPQALTAGGELTVQVEAHRIAAGEVVSIVKSGLFTLEFEPSLMGGEEPFDTNCSLRERLLAALAAFETMQSQVEVLTPAAYGALTIKRATTFYLVDSDAPPPDDDDDEGEIEDPPPGPVAVTGVLLSPATADVPLNTTVNLTATVVPGNAANKNVFWSSGNTAVATVNQNGTVTATGSGIANITVATVDGGFTAFCAVTVPAVLPGLWQGSKTVNGVTISINGGHVTINGKKTVADYGIGSMYFTNNVTDVSNIAACPMWAECKAGDIITFAVKNKTGTCNEIPANAACQIRDSANTVLCGATWGTPTGTYSYTFAADRAVLGIFCYLSPGAVATNYAFDVEVSLNGTVWI